MSDIRENLGKRIRQFRKEAKLTQAKLAEAAGLSTYYAGQLERGEASPSLSAVSDIAAALGLTLSELFLFPSEETPEQIINELVQLLLNKNITQIDDLNLLMQTAQRLTVTRQP